MCGIMGDISCDVGEAGGAEPGYYVSDSTRGAECWYWGLLMSGLDRKLQSSDLQPVLKSHSLRTTNENSCAPTKNGLILKP